MNAADRALVEALYRALRMVAAAVRTRYGVVIRVELSTDFSKPPMPEALPAGIDRSAHPGV